MKLNALVTLTFFSCLYATQEPSQEQVLLWKAVIKRSSDMVVPFTKDLIEQSTKPIIIKAFAVWCPHCTKMKPIFEQLEKDLGKKYTFTEFDIDKSPEFSTQLNIKSLPTFIFYKNKKETGREVGSMSPDNLKKFITQYLG